MRSTRNLNSRRAKTDLPQSPAIPISVRRTIVAIALATLLAFTLSAVPTDKHLSVYSLAANYSMPIIQRESRDYIGLLELLEPLGKVSAKSDNSRWRLRYNNVEADFQVGKT